MHVFVNVSNSPESDPTAHRLTVSVSISLIVLLLLLATSLTTLNLRLKQKDVMNACVKKKPVSSLAADVNSIRDEDCQKIQITESSMLPMGAIAKWLSLAGLGEGKDDDISCRHSDSVAMVLLKERLQRTGKSNGSMSILAEKALAQH